MATSSTPASATHSSAADSLADDLRRAAGTTSLAVVTLVLSGIALALFFGGMGSVFGPINDVLLGITFVLLVPALLATRRLAERGWFSAVALVGVAGIVELVIGQVLLVTGVISLQASFLTLGIGFLAFAAWATSLAVLTLRRELLSPAVGRWALAFAATLVLAAVTWSLLPLAAWSVFGIALFIAFTGWLLTLAGALRRASGAVNQP